MKLTLEPRTEPIRQGWPTVLTVVVENSNPDLWVHLERAAVGESAAGDLAWRRSLLGAVVYHAADDVYRHHTLANTTTRVSVSTGLIPPGRRLEAMLPVKLLELGKRRISVEARCQTFPSGETPGRVYVPPVERMSAVVTYRPLGDAAFPGGEVIVRGHPHPTTTLTADLEVDVTADDDDPAQAALERVGTGAMLLDRCRRIGGAWVVRDARGGTHLVKGERQLRCGPIAPEVFRQFDTQFPFEEIVVVFRGEAGCALRDAGVLPLEGLELGQQLLQPGDFWLLAEEAAQRRLRISWEAQSTVNQGVVVSG